MTESAARIRVIPFMNLRRHTGALSVLAVLVALLSLGLQGLNLGLDFKGGLLLELAYPEAVEPEQVREQLGAAGYPQAVVVHYGSEQELLVRLGGEAALSADLDERLLLASLPGNPVLNRAEFVGGQVGEELRDQGGLALIVALLMVMFYVSFRFQYKFAVGAILALIHDVLITLGVFSLTGWDFDLTVLAALLAVIGYSLNDTIVVSDRIRENFRRLRSGTPREIIDISLTQTLARTLVTSLTTLLVLATLYLLGGELIRGFAGALIIGVLVGTYSSIYVAANTLLLMKLERENLLLPVKEGQHTGQWEEMGGMPPQRPQS